MHLATSNTLIPAVNSSYLNSTNLNWTYLNLTYLSLAYLSFIYLNLTYLNSTFLNSTFLNSTYLNLSYLNSTCQSCTASRRRLLVGTCTYVQPRKMGEANSQTLKSKNNKSVRRRRGGWLEGSLCHLEFFRSYHQTLQSIQCGILIFLLLFKSLFYI